MLRLMTAAAEAPSTPLPRWWPSRFYYGWALVWALGITATVSYGVLSYAFAVFITPMGSELGWSKTEITGAFSLGAVVAGLAAVPIGRWVDRQGPRWVMTSGSILASVLLVLWARVESVTGFYAIWALLGVASAAVLYEPAFAVLAWWFHARRGRALTVLTFLGGFASVIFVPLATWLVSRYGWREALLWLAGVHAAGTVPLHALVLRRRPQDHGLPTDGSSPAMRSGTSEVRSVPVEVAVRSPEFRWLTAAFALATVATTAVSVHLVPLLLERGFGLGFAGGAMGLLGLMALPGRLVFTPLGGWWPRPTVTAFIFALQAFACAVLLSSHEPIAVWVFVVLFGAGFGAITPARAALIAELYGPAHYGRISGTLALVLALARAGAPVGASLVYAAAGESTKGYDAVVAVLLGLSVMSAGAALAIRRGSPITPVTTTPATTSAIPDGL